MGDKLLVFLEGGLLNERKAHSEWTQLVILKKLKKIMLLVTRFPFYLLETRGKNPLKSICYFRRPRSSILQNKGTCGVNPTSVDNLDQDCELGGVGSVNGKKQQISCNPDVLMGVNLCYDGLLRLKLFEYKFY